MWRKPVKNLLQDKLSKKTMELMNSPLFPVNDLKAMVRAMNTANKAMRQYNREKGLKNFPRNWFVLMEFKPGTETKLLGSIMAEKE